MPVLIILCDTQGQPDGSPIIWFRPALPAPASKPVAGIIGVAEERFGLRKGPTAPMFMC